MYIFAYSDTGKVRQINEDSIYYTDKKIGELDNLFIVADGLGGYNAGEYASKLAIYCIKDYVTKHSKDDIYSLFNEAIINANNEIYKESLSDINKNNMGTTVILASIIDNTLYVACVGDSRLYIVNNKIIQISKDHTVAQDMVNKGITHVGSKLYNSNKHKLIRAVGVTQDVIVDNFEYNLIDNDIIVMCSDGLNTMLSDDEIYSAVIKSRNENKDIAKYLVSQANNYGGVDNTSVIVILTKEVTNA